MAERRLPRLPRWPGLIGTVASVAGLGIAGYLTYEHFTGSSSLVCSDKGIVNCLAVTTSSYAMVAGVPVAVLGLIFAELFLQQRFGRVRRSTVKSGVPGGLPVMKERARV